jgi:hypothetical protein
MVVMSKTNKPSPINSLPEDERHELHKIIIHEYFHKGRRISDIANELGTNYRDVYNFTRKLRDEWKENNQDIILSFVAKSRNEIQYIREQLWEAWYASKQRIKEISQTAITNKDGDIVQNIKRITEIEQKADTKYMDKLLRCMELEKDIILMDRTPINFLQNVVVLPEQQVINYELPSDED